MSEVPTTPVTPVLSKLAKSDLNLVWLDCEMSGLDPERERLLEIADRCPVHRTLENDPQILTELIDGSG